MSRESVEIYKNDPENSAGKQLYDCYNMPFQDYLNKYYSNPDLSRWEYVNQKFVLPLFDGTKWEDYWIFLNQVKPKFVPDKNKISEFWIQIKDDNRFSFELKYFFTFLYSIGFYRGLSFEEWLNATNWLHPWYENEKEGVKSIDELLSYNNSENYIKSALSGLTIF